jgi:sedoheptulose-bisphosphatase
VESGLTLGQVAHGLILRCFVKRWLKLPVDDPLPMMLSPGALAMLRYVLLFLLGLVRVHSTDTQCYNSYKNHDVNKPAFFMGMALPATE